MSTKNSKPPVNWKKKLFTEVTNLNEKLYGGRIPEEVHQLLKEVESPEVKPEFHKAKETGR